MKFNSEGFEEVFTAQNLQPLVQVSPINMKVAVPPLQHSVRFGHLASSQTVAILDWLTVFLTKEKVFENVLPLNFKKSGAGPAGFSIG